MDAVTKGIAENEGFHSIVSSLANKLKGRTLIIVDRIEHGDRLAGRIGEHCLWVRGSDNLKTRQEVVEKLKKNENAIAIATSGIFNTGINVFVHNLINAAGGQAEHQIIQRFGRGLRVAKDKEGLLYFDFFFRNNDYLKKHSKKRIEILEKEGHKITIMENIEEYFKL
jgi:superfamily II DNA or RNA helicase